MKTPTRYTPEPETNTSHTISGRTYRICTYRTARGWSSFAESSSAYLGATGEHASHAVAKLCALMLARADAARYARPAGLEPEQVNAA